MDVKVKGFILVSFTSIVWAVLIILSKLILNKGVDVFIYSFQMISIAAVFIALYVSIFHRAELVVPSRKLLPKLLLIALVGTAGAYLVGYYGLEHSSSINYGFLVKTTVVFTVILAHFLLGEELNLHKALLVVLLLMGVYLITTEGKGLVPNKFDILIVLSAFFYALANNISKMALRDINSESLSMYRMLFGSIFVFIFVFSFKNGIFSFNYPLYIVAASLHLAALMLLLYKTLRITSVSYLSMMSMFTPIIVTIIGIIFLEEKFTPIQAVGGFLIIMSGIGIHKKNI